MRQLCIALTMLTILPALAADCPVSGPERIEWMRERLTGAVNKFHPRLQLPQKPGESAALHAGH